VRAPTHRAALWQRMASSFSCAHVRWPSVSSSLRYCDSSPPPNSLDSDLLWLRSRATRNQRYNIGKHTRKELSALFEALRPIANPSGSSRCGIECIWPLLSCVLANTQSQGRQDMFLIPALLPAAGNQPGTFVEIGAFTGVSLSNTCLYERCFNWTGLLVEALPANFAELTKSGRRAKMVHSAVCGAGTQPPFVRMTRPTAGNGNIAKQIMNGTSAPSGETDLVPCAPLGQIMDSAGLPGADFLSLDVEGAELEVLMTFRPSRFKMIMVETETYVKDVGRVSDKLTIAKVHRTITDASFELAADMTNIHENTYNKNRVYRRAGVAVPRALSWSPLSGFVITASHPLSKRVAASA